MNKPIRDEEREDIEEALKGCRAGTYDALSEFRTSGNVDSFNTFLTAVLQKFVEPEFAELLDKDKTDLHFAEDLGVDSMTMMEIVIVVEECLGIKMENEDLMEIQTYGDLDSYVSSKL